MDKLVGNKEKKKHTKTPKNPQAAADSPSSFTSASKFLRRLSQAEVPGSSTWLAAVLPDSHKNLLLYPAMGWKPAGTSTAH